AVLFPNRFQHDNRIRANAATEFPDADAPFQYRMNDKGLETVIAVCADGPTEVDGIRHDFDKFAFTPVENYTQSVTQASAARAKNRPGGATSPLQAVTANEGREISRAAIKVEVR